MARAVRYVAGIAVVVVLVPLVVACSSTDASHGSGAPSASSTSPARVTAFPTGYRFQSGVPLSSLLFVNANSQAAVWARSHANDPRAQAILQRIADQPTGLWLGAWSGDIQAAVSSYTTSAAAANRMPILVAYNIPERDCGGQSAGGMADETAYDTWINGFAAGLDHRKAVVILEPDALAEINCMSATARDARLRMLSSAVKTLRQANALVFLDAGHANWAPVDQMAQLLAQADVADASGFSLNVSNYDPVGMETSYGEQLNAHLRAPKPFIIDTSRDGMPTATSDWCNPDHRELGPLPQTGQDGAILLWIKAPGESDGDCGMGTGIPAGQFSPDLAQRLLGSSTPVVQGGGASSAPSTPPARVTTFPTGYRFQSGAPLSSLLFVDSNSQAAVWARSNPNDPRAQAILHGIADQPTGLWLGAWSGDIKAAVSSYMKSAASAHRIPILVAYDMPGRDCGGQSAGGQADEATYDAWINGFAAGLDHRKAVVVLEPDALAQLDCLSTSAQSARLRMLAYGVTTLGHAKASVFIDAGHANWVPADQMAKRLADADVADASGFSLNVSNYDPVSMETSYGSQLNSHLSAPKPFIIDSSRDGTAPTNNEWCNPDHRELGPVPQTGQDGAILLWIKAPGESDGNCGIGAGIPAGQFSPTLAQGLLTGS